MDCADFECLAFGSSPSVASPDLDVLACMSCWDTKAGTTVIEKFLSIVFLGILRNYISICVQRKSKVTLRPTIFIMVLSGVSAYWDSMSMRLAMELREESTFKDVTNDIMLNVAGYLG